MCPIVNYIAVMVVFECVLGTNIIRFLNNKKTKKKKTRKNLKKQNNFVVNSTRTGVKIYSHTKQL